MLYKSEASLKKQAFCFISKLKKCPEFYTVDIENEKIRLFNLQVDMRGIVKNGDKKAPTAGYFEISKKKDQYEFSSGSLKTKK